MRSSRASVRCHRLLTAAAIASVATPLLAQTTATWLAPVSGSWDTSSNWSTGAVPTAGTHALIDAAGAPYTVTAGGVYSTRLDLSSPDATLDVGQSIGATAVYLNAGTALFHGSAVSDTQVRGTRPLTIDSTSAAISNLTLATTLQGVPITGTGHAFRYLDFYNSLTLDGGELHMGVSLCPKFHDDFSVTGTGVLTCDLDGHSYVSGNAPNLTFGPGVTLKTIAGGGNLSIDSLATVTNQPRLYNNGTISAETPGLTISVGYDLVSYGTTRLCVINGGTLAASNGGTLKIALPGGGTPGNVALGAGGTVYFTGTDFTLDRPLTVGSTSRLQLEGGWKIGAALTLDAGTLTVASNPTTSSPIQYVNSPTVQLAGMLSAAALPLLNTTPATRIAPEGTIDLGGVPFSFSSVPGQWTFPPERSTKTPGGGTSTLVHTTISNGTLSDAPSGNDLLPGGGGVNLSGVTVGFPLTIDDGVIVASSNTTFAQPVSLSGTGRLILESFSNPGGITATGGTLDLRSLPAAPGSVLLSGSSTLQLDFSTTLPQARALPFGTPATLAVGPAGKIDCQSASVDLSALGHDLALTGDTSTATLANATLSDPSHAHPLRVYAGIPGATSYLNRLSNVTCQADIVIDPASTLVLFQSSLVDMHVTGGGTLDDGPASTPNPVTLDNVTLDADLRVRNTTTPLTVLHRLITRGTLTIAAGGAAVDLTTATLTLDYAATSPADGIRGYIIGGQLRSSAADSSHRIGYVDNGSAVEVGLTIAGDANLDGVIGPDDYALLDRGRGASPAGARWQDGDFNYDGQIDGADYLLIDSGYLSTHPAAAPSLLERRESEFGPVYAAQLAAVLPEPSSLAGILAATLLAIAPRHRRGRGRN